MSETLKLGTIPESAYADYRCQVIFKAYKWDPQVGDQNTVSNRVLLMDRALAGQLAGWAEALSAETELMEEVLLARPDLVRELGLPRRITRLLGPPAAYRRQDHIRLMRFDFHPTEDGWAISEVNSDVPGGLAEASAWPEIAAAYFEAHEPGPGVGQALLEAFRARLGSPGRIALIHATAYADDRQVMQFLSDYLARQGWEGLPAAPDHLHWRDRRALILLRGREGPVDGLIRFFPLEWLINLPWWVDWRGYFQPLTPSCNHPIAILAQSKRLPLVWDRLGLDLPVWKMLLPETAAPGRSGALPKGWIHKPALGRVGEGISIREAASQAELAQISRAVVRHPGRWISQRQFKSRPLAAEGQLYHLCLGVFTVNGRWAGFYGRLSGRPRIDAAAGDLPVLISKGIQPYG